MKSLKQENVSQKYYNNKRTEIIELIPDTVKKVLDIGCGSGYFGKSLKEKLSIEVWGIEISEKAGLHAKDSLDKIIIKNIENAIDDLPDHYFDFITFNDVLEHLIDPYNILNKIKNKLTPDGIVVCSIPNIRHRSILLQLLFQKDWKYTDDGILDKTHLRFFTKKSIIRMFKELNYKIILIKGINDKLKILFWLFNILTLGYTDDIRFKQFVCISSPE